LLKKREPILPEMKILTMLKGLSINLLGLGDLVFFIVL